MVDAAAIDWAHVGQAAAQRALHTVGAVASRGSLTTMAGIAIVMAIEVVVLGWKKSSVYRLFHPSKSTRTDIVWFLVKIFGLQTIILGAISLGGTVMAVKLADKYVGFHVISNIQNPVLRIFLYVFATDFVDYWVHRGRHGIGWWWEFHKAHHSATEFNAITTSRGHPFDGVAIVLSSAVPLAILGGSVGDSIAVLTIFAVHSGLTHSMLPWKWGWFGRYVIYPPTGHRIHHSALPEHRDKNFAGVFPIWDWIFGTYYKGDVLNEEVGVDDNYQNKQGLWFDLVESCRRAIRSVRGKPVSGEAVIDEGRSRT